VALHPAQLFSRSQAMTALTLAQLEDLLTMSGIARDEGFLC
jgi:hypothetical protein